jgi:glycosyltransferase involved in cell wall biosynthesis
VRIIYRDSSGGIKRASELLISSFRKMGVETQVHQIRPKESLFFNFLNLVVKLSFRNREPIILHHFDAIMLGIFLNKFFSKNLINVVHTDLVSYYTTAGPVKKLIIKILFTLLKEKKIVFVSCESEVRGKSFFHLKNTCTIYNISEPIKIIREPRHEKLIRLGSISRLHSDKNIDLLIKIVRFCCENQKDTQLLIYGEGPQLKSMTAYIDRLGCNKLVKLMGWSDNKENMYNSIDAMISFSSVEGFGMSILESISYGKPVFHPDCPSGPREIMSPNTDYLMKTSTFERTEVGYLVKPVIDAKPYSLELSEYEKDYVDYLASFIDEVRNNQFSMQYDMSRFSADTIVGQWQKLFESQ